MKHVSKLVKGFIALSTAFMLVGGAGEVSASADLSDQQKEYYNQYVEIVQDVMAQHEGVTLEVAPAEEFSPEDWVEPEEFKALATERANATIVFNEQQGNFTLFSSDSATKSVTVDSNGAVVGISIKGEFTTLLSGGRQIFDGIDRITSWSSTGTWEQTGYTPKRLDGGRTYSITVGGKVTLNGLKSSHNITVEFYCSSTGVVS